jgi:tetratricopeptide (TPR) repeat protein
MKKKGFVGSTFISLFVCFCFFTSCTGNPAILDSAEAYNKRGISYADRGKYDQAIAAYTDAIRLDPNHAMAYMNRANAYDNKGNFDMALADYDQAIRITPNNPLIYFNRGLAYAHKEDYVQARKDWEEALRINPNFSRARENLDILSSMGY